jgi:hypothetical protein
MLVTSQAPLDPPVNVAGNVLNGCVMTISSEAVSEGELLQVFGTLKLATFPA